MIKELVIIALLGFAVYANALGNGFVSDDIATIAENPNIGNIFSSSGLPSCVNSLIYRVSGPNPAPYRLVNIVMHIATSLLVFFFLRLFFSRAAGFWGALIFAAHPVHTEAVTWISGKPHLFAAFFVLASFLAYHAATARAGLKKGCLAVSLIAYLCGLYSNFFTFFFPAMLIVYDVTFERWRRTWKLWLVFSGLAVFRALLLLYNVDEGILIMDRDASRAGLSNPVFNMIYSIANHFYLLIWPAKLTFYHEPYLISSSLLTVEGAVLAAIALSLPFLFRKAKPVFFAIAIFVLFLAPTYSPVMISWLIAERYMYLPSLAFCVFAAFLIDRYAARARPFLRGSAYIGLTFLIIGYSARTVVRNFDWRDHAAIWRATEKASPYSPKAHNNMGDVYCREGNPKKAVEEFRRAIELNPDYADAYHNLANTYEHMGKTDEAIENYSKALYINPDLYQSRQRLNALSGKR